MICCYLLPIIRNQITLLRGHVEAGVVFFLDKIEETTSTCDNLLLTWKTHGTPLGDRKVKETMHRTVSNLILIAFITGNSSLEPLIEGLCAQIHVNLR